MRNLCHFVNGGYVSTAISDASDFLRIAMIPPPITSAIPRTTNSVGARSQMHPVDQCGENDDGVDEGTHLDRRRVAVCENDENLAHEQCQRDPIR